MTRLTTRTPATRLLVALLGEHFHTIFTNIEYIIFPGFIFGGVSLCYHDHNSTMS